MLNRMLLLLILEILAVSCAQPRVSPWDTTVPSNKTNATAKNLAWLNQTAAEQSLPFTIGILGDPQGTPQDLKKVIHHMNQRDDLEFILVLGDLTDYGLKHEYEWAYEGLSNSKVPWFTAVGNHDALSKGKVIYERMFGPPNYTFNYAELKFIMWNNNKFEYNTSNFDWLQSEVSTDSVVASHIPPVVDIHDQGEVDLWTSINGDAGIVASLHGHRGGSSPYYWESEGIPYFVVAKTSNVHYSLATFHEDGSVTYKACHNGVCEDAL